MIVESLYLLMGKKEMKILPQQICHLWNQRSGDEKKDHNYYFIFSEDTNHVASPSSSKKKILSDFFFSSLSHHLKNWSSSDRHRHLKTKLRKMNSIKTNYNFHVLGAPYYYEQNN